MIVLIPAYEPDDRLPELVADLTATARQVSVVVVDDGSGPRFGPVFASVRRLGATVLAHPANRGKGAALRTGLAHIRMTHPGQDVVCADRDGQHLVADILAAALLAANYALMWLLTSAGLALLVAKAITETVLYLTSFAIQSRVVFRSRSRTSPVLPTDRPEDYPMSRRNVVKRPMSTSTTA